MKRARSLLAAVVSAWHLHMPAVVFHHPAAGTLIERHARIGSHARHRRCHKGRNKQQNSSELTQQLHTNQHTPRVPDEGIRRCAEQSRLNLVLTQCFAYKPVLIPVRTCLSASKSRKVHTGLMKFRTAWAGVLTAVMLFVSSAASPCEARCDLGGLRPVCHSVAASPQGPKAPMSSGMCHGNPRPENGARALAISWSSPCSHHICAQQPATLTNPHAAIAPVLILSRVAHGNAQHFEADLLVGTSANRGPPFFRPPSPVDLHITLRV